MMLRPYPSGTNHRKNRPARGDRRAPSLFRPDYELTDIDLGASRGLQGGDDFCSMEPVPLLLGNFTCSCQSSMFVAGCGAAQEALVCESSAP
jgi:hypothetical protein